MHFARAVVLLLTLLVARAAIAGGGPENTFVVVNSASWASLTVANHYIRLRQIPPLNVYYLPWPTGAEGIDGVTFREKLLVPLLETMEKRGIYPQIDCVVYSTDFPTQIQMAGEYPPQVKFSEQATPTASLNSATYLWHLAMLKTPTFFDFAANHYMRNFVNATVKANRAVDEPTRGFHAWYGWLQDGRLLEAGGQPYLLSTLLAVTSGRGNSVREAIDYLTASAKADATFPKGTIYFTKTADVRSTTREEEVAGAIAELAKLGVSGKVVTTEMPRNAADVAGLISGVASFSWAQTRSRIVPGAICDNFTSFGGILTEGASQTPLTEFLRYGAAGSAGTVVEPYALPMKFASPNIFVHYARGCSLAEAYYQSLFSPAQVLIVGDALCRPWADIPQLRVSGLPEGGKVKGTLTLKPQVRFRKETEVDRLELYVDGRRVSIVPAGESLVWDSTSECDGYHELRVVATAATPIETRGFSILNVLVENDGRSAVMAASPAGRVRWGEALTVAVKAAGAQKIFVLNNGRALGTISGAQGQIKLDPKTLGLGPVSLQAICLTGNGYRDRIVPPPVQLTVEPSPPLAAVKDVPKKLLPGLMLRLPKGEVVPLQPTMDNNWLSAGGIGANQPFLFQGFFDADREDVYQFQIWHYGELKVVVDGQLVYDQAKGDYSQQYVPVNLAKGTHRLTVSGRTGSDTKLRMLFGGPGMQSLNGRLFQHPAK